MRYTTGWTREKIRTPEAYQRWLDSLVDGDEVLLQQFHPAARQSIVLGMPFEQWQFERVRVMGSSADSRGNSYSIDRAKGVATYHGGGKEWGNVFPARLVPCHGDMPTNELGQSAWGHMPIYEPLFLGCYRHFFFAGHQLRREFYQFIQGYRHYLKDVERGRLLVLFSEDDFDEMPALPEGLRYLYAEYIDR
jgi:hypothetical protein